MGIEEFDRRAWPQGSSVTMEQAADGWPLRRFDWPASAARGSILFFGGRGDIIEKYLESFAHWHDRGWGVTSLDWRGQGGSGRLTERAGVGHFENFALWIDDLAALFARWRDAQRGPHILIAHSMGGHLVLRALIERRIAPDAAVLVAPMLGLADSPAAVRVSSWIANLMVRIGPHDRPAWKQNERPALPGASRQKFLTSSIERYDDELWWKQEHPELGYGPPSWRWLVEAYASTTGTARPGCPESVTANVLLVGTEGDKLVSPAAIRRFAARIPGARLKMFGPDVAHEILRERDGPRDEALAAIDAFLDECAPAR